MHRKGAGGIRLRDKNQTKSLMLMRPRSQIDWSFQRLLLFLVAFNCYS